MRKLLVAVLGILAACMIVPLFGAAAILGTGSADCLPVTPSPALMPGSGRHPPVVGWNAEQVTNATTIITVGNTKAVPVWGWVIAVATAIQESGLRNLPGGADDSIGLFQQRPSQGWGTPRQLADPAYQASKFFDKLLTVHGWQQMPLAQAAQAVQISAQPQAYAQHTLAAIRLVTRVGSALGLATPSDLEQCASTCVVITAADSGSCIEAATVFGRAQSWLTAWSGGPVPYSSSGDPVDWFQGYRRDCSGYVSMTLGLDGPGLTTSGLAARSTIISRQDLRPGALLINTAPNLRGHVVLFEQWADASMTSYYGYEQSGDGGTHHRIIPYPYFGGYPMVPYRLGK